MLSICYVPFLTLKNIVTKRSSLILFSFFRRTMITLNRSTRRSSFVRQTIPSTFNTIFSESCYTTSLRKTHCVAVSKTLVATVNSRRKSARGKKMDWQNHNHWKTKSIFLLVRSLHNFYENITTCALKINCCYFSINCPIIETFFLNLSFWVI